MWDQTWNQLEPTWSQFGANLDAQQGPKESIFEKLQADPQLFKFGSLLAPVFHPSWLQVGSNLVLVVYKLIPRKFQNNPIFEKL